MKKEDFEATLVGLAPPGKIIFDAIRGHCGGYRYKIGLGMTGPELIQLRRDFINAHSYQSVFLRTIVFDIEKDVDDAFYGHTYLLIPHIHFEAPTWKENTSTSTSTDLQAMNQVDSSKSSDQTVSPLTPENGSK